MEIKLRKKDKIKINNPEEIFKIMKQVLIRENKIRQNREHFWVIGLNNNNVILFIELISLGSLTTTIADPGKVFQLAVHKDALKVILVHNHPSENLSPSDADIDMTDRLIQSGKILDRTVIEHLIISEKGYYSFAKSGLMDSLKLSKKYSLKYLEEDRIVEEIAKAMKNYGESTAKITKYTGLAKDKINKL